MDIRLHVYILLLFVVISSVPAQLEYIGCYVDHGVNRRLRGEEQVFPYLTPELCINFCRNKVYAYAGLQYRIFCFCGDDTPWLSDKKPEIDCEMDCPGDYINKCGGTWRNSIYRTGAVPMQLEYVGCYVDGSKRMLSGSVTTFSKMTPRKCVDFCKDSGYHYAGLQFGVLCFCGYETPETMERKPEKDCSNVCPGDKYKKCGGTWRNNIYKTSPLQPPTMSSAPPTTQTAPPEPSTTSPTPPTTQTEPPKPSTTSPAPPTSVVPVTVEEVDNDYIYVGCYRDQAVPRNLRGYFQDFPETLTPQHCVSLCKRKGFIFAGLQYGLRCYCGNRLPFLSDKLPESECNAKCSGNLIATCGGTFRNSIYITEVSYKNNESIFPECRTSITIVNGQTACRNEVVFEDHFESLSPEKWKHSVQIANEPDYEFVVFNSKPENSYTENGKLIIKPTLLPENDVRRGVVPLENCTGRPGTNKCGYEARSYLILPPVQSARLTTRKSFAFRYGKVEISARFPLGDWLVPELWLEPKVEVYGPGYASGRIRIAMSRGNMDLTSEGQYIGNKQMESCVLMGIGDNIRGRRVIRETGDGWYKNYHNYTVIWTPDDIIFTIDGEQPQSLVPSGATTLSDVVGFTNEVDPVWSSGSKLAPFDKDFYVSLGVSAGGVRDFPDYCINNGKQKPWKNLDVTAMLDFWNDRNSWKQTWHDGLSSLEIDYVKVTAL